MSSFDIIMTLFDKPEPYGVFVILLFISFFIHYKVKDNKWQHIFEFALYSSLLISLFILAFTFSDLTNPTKVGSDINFIMSLNLYTLISNFLYRIFKALSR